MSTFGETPSEWLDSELRRIPLPQGMIDRLRALATMTDSSLDAELRSIPLPAGMILRLQQEAMRDESAPVAVATDGMAIDDATLDRALRDVPVPVGLASRLSAIAIDRAKPLEEERLRDVPLPAGFSERLAHTALWACLTEPEIAPASLETVSRISGVGKAVRRYAQHRSSIVAFVAALSACYLLGMNFVLRDTFLPGSERSPTIAVGSRWHPEAGDTTTFTFGTTGQLPEALPLDTHALADSVHIEAPWTEDQQEEAPTTPRIADLLATVRPWQSDSVMGVNSQPTPQPVKVSGPQAKGLVPAWKDPDLLLFLLARGVHPVVPLTPAMQIASDASLLTCRIPTTTSTESFESASSLLSRRQLNNSQRQAAMRWLQAEVRPEEFLSALNYGFTPPAPGKLALRTAGGVAPFGLAQQRLLQIALLAGQPAAPSREKTDKQQAVAEDVRLSVTFNPRTVASYRLIGHEATSVLGVHAAEVNMTLRAGDVCTGLFEVELRGGGDDLVATAEITWRDPLGSETRRETRRISRWQLADSFAETPPSVQAAALAAEIAELMRHSQFTAGRGHSWGRVRQVAAEVHPTVAEEPTFRRLLGLVERAEQWGIR